MFTLTLDPPEAQPRLAVITIDRAGEKVNTIAPELFPEILEVFAAIEAAGGVAGIVLISGKPDNFVAGADVEVFARASGRGEIERFSREGHRILDKIAGSPIPVVAAIHGAALGAGLELALACSYRLATDSPKTVLALPEVMLGLFPGGGGVSRLPRLIGLRESLDLILTGRNVRPRRARRLGLVDAVVEPEALLMAARAAAAALATGEKTARKEPPQDMTRTLLEGNRLGRALIFRQARQQVLKKTQGLYPAPLVALDVMSRGIELSLAESLALEPPAFAELATGSVSRALVSLFRRSNALKRQSVAGPDGAPIEGKATERLGLVGGGFMGGDIAIVAAEKGIETRIRDVAAAPLAGALGHVHKYFDRKGRSIGARNVFKPRSKVSGGLTLAGFQTMDLIIEAVPESLPLKQEVFAQLEALAPRTTILASNTSALPIAAIGARLAHKDRLIGLHFFSPVPKMPLLEIVRAPETSQATIAACLRFATQIGKTPIVVADGPGFYTTRMLGFYLMAALEMILGGATIEEVDRGARKIGWPVGPIALLDEVGIDVGAKVAKTLAEAFPGRISVPDSVDMFLGQERFGRKSGRGFYLYPPKGKKKVDPEVYSFFKGRVEAKVRPDPEELGERLTMIAAMEAVRCLEEGILASADDGDIGGVFGIGYPPLRGGPFRHLEELGLEVVVARLSRLRERYGEAYAAPQLLTELAAAGRTFSSLDRKDGQSHAR